MNINVTARYTIPIGYSFGILVPGILVVAILSAEMSRSLTEGARLLCGMINESSIERPVSYLDEVIDFVDCCVHSFYTIAVSYQSDMIHLHW